MKRNLLISALFSTVAAFAGEHMTVAVCNVGELPALVIEHAEAEAAYVFQSMGVEIRWTELRRGSGRGGRRGCVRISSCGCASAGISPRRATLRSKPWAGRS